MPIKLVFFGIFRHVIGHVRCSHFHINILVFFVGLSLIVLCSLCDFFNMRQTIKLTPLFCNMVPSLFYIRILSIHIFTKFPKNWWFTKIKETPLFLRSMLSEHSSERFRFLIRKGDKNADLIGKESLWIYTVYLSIKLIIWIFSFTCSYILFQSILILTDNMHFKLIDMKTKGM
jgi:hypothetical protein